MSSGSKSLFLSHRYRASSIFSSCFSTLPSFRHDHSRGKVVLGGDGDGDGATFQALQRQPRRFFFAGTKSSQSLDTDASWITASTTVKEAAEAESTAFNSSRYNVRRFNVRRFSSSSMLNPKNEEQLWQRTDAAVARSMSTSSSIRHDHHLEDDDRNNHDPEIKQHTTTTSGSQKNAESNDEVFYHSYGDTPRTSLLMELTDRLGVLHEVLRYFWKYDVNICRIESRPQKTDDAATPKVRVFDFFVDFEGSATDENCQKLLRALEPITQKLLILDEKQVHWFPRHISELDLIANRTLDAGNGDLESDHPGFHDPVYRDRRTQLARWAIEHRWNHPIPRIDYTPEERSVWSAVWDRMEDLWERYACQEFLHSIRLMKQHCNYQRNDIPQIADVATFLKQRTNFSLRPVSGLLSSRDFLNGLAFRVFFCTQYIRHHSKPLYTPEPDICHELMGHAPMFADRDFADFSQEIGLASLGASDDEVDKLAHCYWHSVEFGLCREKGENKAYGAGLLSSFGELEYACGGNNSTTSDNPGQEPQLQPQILPWDPEVAARQSFPITTYQPTYFLADSLQDAKIKMRSYCENLQRPFFALHNPQNQTIHIDRPVRRTKGIPPAPPSQ